VRSAGVLSRSQVFDNGLAGDAFKDEQDYTKASGSFHLKPQTYYRRQEAPPLKYRIGLM